MINLNANVTSVSAGQIAGIGKPAIQGAEKPDFSKIITKYLSEVDQQQKDSDAAIKGFLTGSNPDMNSVVSAVAKADNSFKLLVGVRNKIVEAYRETMRMQV